MASPSSLPTTRIWFRTVIVIGLMVVLFYVGRPLYWKISATIHDIRHNKQSVREGISQIVQEAQRSVGWYHDESDSGFREVRNKKSGVAASRRLLLAGDQREFYEN
ncbi:unnamed protein product [Arabis nemorensis]|uniref:Uncharacterized protein n=1 Tax=Arabis nemorensis TaxID=586526 RepID=A0A565CNG2_9BRAS|nr:unnamed protein product [Arabis nemorensis]